jgi:hypothetical protein
MVDGSLAGQVMVADAERSNLNVDFFLHSVGHTYDLCSAQPDKWWQTLKDPKRVLIFFLFRRRHV